MLAALFCGMRLGLPNWICFLMVWSSGLRYLNLPSQVLKLWPELFICIIRPAVSIRRPAESAVPMTLPAWHVLPRIWLSYPAALLIRTSAVFPFSLVPACILGLAGAQKEIVLIVFCEL